MLKTLLLAAGAGRRFGADKRLAAPVGKPALALRTLQRYRELGPVRVVVRGDDDPLRALLLDAVADVELVNARDHHLGMGHSLAAGAQSLLDDGWQGDVVIALADMPFVQADTLTSMASQPVGWIVQPFCDGRPGHPVRFPSELLPALAGLSGDTGAREVLAANKTRLLRLDVDDTGVLADVDTPADLPSHERED